MSENDELRLIICNQEKEIKRLEAELEKVRNAYADLIEIHTVGKIKASELKRANEILKTALEFYADQKQMNHGLEITCEETAFVNEDDFQSIDEVEPNEYREYFYYVYGKRARQALSKIEALK